MRAYAVVALVLSALALSACKPINATPDAVRAAAPLSGRYTGVGLYAPSEQWTRMIQATDPPSGAAPESRARLIDDQVIIVVQDSRTGEVRACGDLTGYCIGMNPWDKTLVSAQTAPINVTDHVKPPEPIEEVHGSLATRFGKHRSARAAQPKAKDNPGVSSPASTGGQDASR